MLRCGCVLVFGPGRVAVRGVSWRVLRVAVCRGVSLAARKMRAGCSRFARGVRKMRAARAQVARCAHKKKETLVGLYCGSPSVSYGSLHVFRRLNRSGRCALNADRLRRYRSRQSVRCLTSRAAAFSKDSSVNSQRPSTRIAPIGGLPLGRFCGDSAISKGKESAHNRLNDAHCRLALPLDER